MNRFTSIRTLIASIVLGSVTLFASSCFQGGLSLQSISGASGEVLVIIPDSTWHGATGDVLNDILKRDVPGMLYAEPMFDVSRVSPNDFDGGLYNATRNIIEVVISDQYTLPKIYYKRNLWAQPQVYIKLQAPDQASMMNLLITNEVGIQTYFKNAELDRYASYFTKHQNPDFVHTIDSMFHMRLTIPGTLLQHKMRNNFFWMYNGRPDDQQNLFVFSVPYTGPSMLDSVKLNQLCDSVTKANLPGPSDSSYFVTEYRTRIYYNPSTYRNKYLGTMRGLWRMENDAMGGPFLRWARVDEQKGRLVVAEAFIYAPNKKKRNNLRQMESILRTWAFNYELKEEQDLARQDSIKNALNNKK